MQIAAAGAGAYGMSYVGAVKALKENGVVPEKYIGCSMGSVVGSLWAAGIEPSHMPHIFNEMMSSYNIFIESVFSIWDLATIWGIVDTQAMQNVMKKYLPNSWDEFEFPFYCLATDVSSHGIRIFGKGYNEDVPPYKAVVASATVAPFMAPTKANINGKEHLFIDGGFLDSMPVKYLDKDASKVLIASYGVNKIGANANIELASGYKQYNNLVDYLLGIYETMNKENVLSDLKGIDFDTLATGTINVKHVFDFTNWDENIQAGYENAKRFLAEHKEVISNGSNR
jgi:NTE family protein